MRNITKREFIILGASMFATGCASKYDMMGKIGSWSIPENELDEDQRSVYFNHKTIDEVLAKGRVVEAPDKFKGLKIIEMSGTPYEMGFQNGRLNREDIKANMHHVLGILRMYGKMHDITIDAMDEVYDLMAPFIPLEDIEEMRGLAHGADIPLSVVHRYHSIAELSEYAGKKQFLRGKKYNKPDPGFLDDPKLQTCSGVVAFGKATKDGDVMHLRVLDWIRELGAHKYPTIHVYHPKEGQTYVSFTYAGYIGCFTGMNENISMGEMGYGNRRFETLEGTPFVFLYKKIGREAETVEDATEIVRDAKRTCSYCYQFSGNSRDKDHPAIMMVSDKYRFETLQDDMPFTDEGDGVTYDGIDDVLFAGHETDKLREDILSRYGSIDVPDMLWFAKEAAMRGNVQCVTMKPLSGEAYVQNAISNDKDDLGGKASEQEPFHFKFGDYL